MGNFQLPRQQSQDASGRSLPGAKLYFYDAGTTTLITVYQDSGFLTPHTNPVVADGDGRFAPIWVQGTDNPFKAELRDRDDVLIYTEDNLSSFDTASGAPAVDRTIQGWHSPLDYGAQGDGTTDDATAVQMALDAAAAGNPGGRVDLFGLTFRVDSQLTVAAGVVLVNGVLDFSQATTPPDPCILAAATKEALVNLASAATIGEDTITLVGGGGAGMAAGDLLQLSSTDDIYLSVDGGELCRIKSVAGDVITLTQQLQATYTTAAQVVRITSANIIQDTTFEDLRIKCKTVGANLGLRIDGGRNIALRNVTVYDSPTGGIEIRYSERVSIEGCHFYDIVGEAITVSHSCRDVSIDACGFSDCSTGIRVGESTGGTSHQLSITGCHLAAGGTGILVDAASSTVAISGCTVDDNSTAGIQAYGAAVSIKGCHVARTGGNAIEVEHRRTVNFTTLGAYSPATATDEGGYVIEGNVVRLASGEGIYYRNPLISVAHAGLVISGNVVSACDAYGIQLDLVNDERDIRVCNNTVINTTNEGIFLDASTGAVTERVTVSGNTCRDNGTSGAIHITSDDIDELQHVVVQGNTVENSTIGLSIKNAADLVVDSNTSDGAGRLIEYETTDVGTVERVAITNNTHKDGGSECIHVLLTSGNIDGLTIRGNHIQESDSAEAIKVDVLSTVTADRVVISDNTVRMNNVAQDAILVDGADPNSARDVSIANNVVDGGLSNIRVNRGQGVSITGNVVNNSNSEAIYLDDCNNVTVSGNTITSPGSGDGIYWAAVSDDLEGGTFSGNTIEGGRIQVETESGRDIEQFSITGNTFRDFADRAVLLQCNGVSQSIIQFFAITGNTIRVTSGGTAGMIRCDAAGNVDIIRTGLIASNMMSTTNSAAKGIYLTGAATATLDDIAMMANFVKCGGGTSFGVELDCNGTTTDLAPTANTFSNCNTDVGATNGTLDFTSSTATDSDRNASI